MYELIGIVSLVSAASAQYAYGVDISQLGTASAFSCLKSSYYSTVFVRGYKPDGSGAADTNAITNINRAYNAGLGIEVYVTPNPTSSKTAATQIDEAVNALVNGGVSVRTLWLLVTSPVNWNKAQSTNLNFISAAIARIRNRGIRPGVYTNFYDWQQITNSASGLGSDVLLWYWHVLGSGPAAETDPNLLDFRAFAGFNAASVKQFGQYESLCGLTINRDIYPVSSAASANATMLAENSTRIVAGTIGL